MSKQMNLKSQLLKGLNEEKDSVNNRELAIEEKIKRADFVMSKDSEEAITNSKLSEKVKTDSFCIPEIEYTIIQDTKKRLLSNGKYLSKSEIIRCGLFILSGLSNEELIEVASKIKEVKKGRRINGSVS